MNGEDATAINGANVKSGDNGHKAVENKERKEMPLALLIFFDYMAFQMNALYSFKGS
jgi:hypothetical protein